MNHQTSSVPQVIPQVAYQTPPAPTHPMLESPLWTLILDEEQLAFLADLGVPESQAQTIIPHNATFQTEDLDTYDSDCDDLSNVQAVLMANISNYGSDVISEDIVQDTNLQA
ncbi:hypothetical protein Tco_1477820 [Tanacetum coccineum]